MSFYKFLKEENEKLIPSERGFAFYDEKNVMAYCNEGDFIAEVVIPEGEEYQECEFEPCRYQADKITLKNIRPLWNAETFKQLVDEGVDIHVQGDFVFCYAADNGYLDVVKFLVENGTDIHINNDNALFLAIDSGHLNVVKYLVEQGADIHFDGECVLRYAAEEGHLEVVKYLVENGADIHANDNEVLNIATEYGYSDIVKYLTEKMN